MKGRKGAKYDKRYKDIVTKSWFVTFDHPADHGYPGTARGSMSSAVRGVDC